MQFSNNRKGIRWFFIVLSFLVIVLILWNTYVFFQIFKDDERVKMELWAEAQKTLNMVTEEDDVQLNLTLEIISKNTSIPIIMTDQNGNFLDAVNFEENIQDDPQKIQLYLDRFKSENSPIQMDLSNKETRILYYGNSNLLIKLKYYPIALLLIIILFALLIFNYYRTDKYATQNKLWAGMAKETAHQIGTPLSSLMGWLEIMKSENKEDEMIQEIEKDISRLQTITERFSKIGSEPVLEPVDLVEITAQAVQYLQSRFSKQVDFSFHAPSNQIILPLNTILHSWTIENLIKNAIDAMKGKGTLDVNITEDENTIQIFVSDSGKGIPKKEFKKVFEPGFTTKKRGWGLGLSLTKRIVEEYHKGIIRVERSELNKGTTMVVLFKKNTK
uniref:sensor histidine kinase n=3 Tax=Flavobacterium sp. TaxID=239 RepID=UPI0040494825